MAVRCQGCGHPLHDGPPALEDLSAQQAAVVGAGGPRISLAGTRFDGLSATTLCTFCLFAATQFPDCVAAVGAQGDHADFDRVEAEPQQSRYAARLTCTTCGWTTRPKTSRQAPNPWQTFNRVQVLHTVVARHRNDPRASELARLTLSSVTTQVGSVAAW